MPKKSNVKIPAIAIIRLIIFLFIAFILFWVYSRTVDFLTQSSLFAVKNVEWDQSISFMDSRPLLALKGRNIFKIDLEKLHKQISGRYPQISQLRVVRQLPDTIQVLAKKRDILLQVQAHNKYLIVDTEGVTMFYTATPLQYPLVRGIPLEKGRVILGATSSIKELNTIVELFQQLRLHPHTGKLRVLAVEAGNLSKIEFTVMPNIQIIVDQEDLGAKVNMLELILQNGKINWAQVKYIDVRFKEPIINDHNPENIKV